MVVALGGQAWWEHRSDREFEQHLLQGIRADLARDSADIATAMHAARARTAGADFLLAELGDPDAGQYHPRPWSTRRQGARKTEVEFLEEALAAYEGVDLTARDAFYMVVSTYSLHRMDLSDATFREATESGGLGVIQEADLRSRIADYYFNSSRFGSTTDDRVQVQWEDFRRAVAAVGLSTIGGEQDDEILTGVREDPTARAELKNARDYAVMQMAAHDVTLRSAEAVIRILDRRK